MKFINLFLVLFTTLVLTGCLLEGDTGNKGVDGANGIDGISCWDLNENLSDDPDEDVNNDGLWNVDDCSSQNEPSQSTEAVLNHQHFCEAFANLGQYPSGCPSNSHSPPTGTLTQQSRDSWYNDGMGSDWSCLQAPPNSGSVSIRPGNNGHYWVVDGGFIANKTTIDGAEELTNATCFNTCASDSDCIASWASSETVGTNLVYQCYHFYHSDTISEWTSRCGTERQDCFVSQTNNQFWSALCP